MLSGVKQKYAKQSNRIKLEISDIMDKRGYGIVDLKNNIIA